MLRYITLSQIGQKHLDISVDQYNWFILQLFFHVFKTMRKDLQASPEVHSTRAPRGEDPCIEGHRDVAKPRRLRLVTPTATNCSGCPRPADASEKQGPALGIQFLKLITDGKGAQEDVSSESLGTVDGLENMLLKWTLPKPGWRKRPGIGPHW